MIAPQLGGTGIMGAGRPRRIGGAVAAAVTGGALHPKAELRQAMLGHRGAVIWLTGLSGAGKSTVANAAEHRLLEAGILTSVLDGDIVRQGLCHGLGFSDFDRKENMRRVAEAALLIAETGALVITALISPFAAERTAAAERCQARGVPFAEVFVNAPLAVCERRDPKLLYRRVRAGEIPAFTGISSPYERPFAPALELHTGSESVEQSVQKFVRLALLLVMLPRDRIGGSGEGV